MNKKIFLTIMLTGILSLVGTSGVFAKANNGQEHRSAVQNVVRELDKVAEKDTSIQTDLRTVSEEENSQSVVVQEKMERIQTRNRIKTFFLGSDYKNLGILRSELVTTQNHLEKLNKALERTTSTTIKTELEAQIKELELILAKANNFVSANESKFSLFGWLIKMIGR